MRGEASSHTLHGASLSCTQLSSSSHAAACHRCPAAPGAGCLADQARAKHVELAAAGGCFSGRLSVGVGALVVAA